MTHEQGQQQLPQLQVGVYVMYTLNGSYVFSYILSSASTGVFVCSRQGRQTYQVMDHVCYFLLSTSF